jgi:hypothetical protein
LIPAAEKALVAVNWLKPCRKSFGEGYSVVILTLPTQVFSSAILVVVY